MLKEEKKYFYIAQILIFIVMKLLSTVDSFHALVQIWSFECLEAFTAMSQRSSFEVEENESEYLIFFNETPVEIDWVCFSIYSAIVRYLGSRFPETLSAVDGNDRTALHYAATIKDNGHFYNLLLHLGANAKAVDKVSISYLLFKKSNCKYIVFTTVWKVSRVVPGTRKF